MFFFLLLVILLGVGIGVLVKFFSFVGVLSVECFIIGLIFVFFIIFMFFNIIK